MLLGFLSSSPAEAQVQGGAWSPSPRLFAADASETQRLTSFGLEHGFPTQSIEAIEYGPSGRMWIGSQAGLFTFDGALVRSLPHPKVGDDRPSETQDQGVLQVISLLRDSQDQMWVGCFGGTLRCYGTDTYSEIDTGEVTGWFSEIYEAKDGAIWAGGMGLLRIENGEVTTILKESGEHHGPYVTSVAESEKPGDETIWISTLDGLASWSPEQGLEWAHRKVTLGTFFDADGRHWHVTPYSFSVDGHTWKTPGPLASVNLRSTLRIDERQTLVVLDQESFVVALDDTAIQVTPFRLGELTNDAIPGPGGSLWVATMGYGLQLREPAGFVALQMPDAAPVPFVCRPMGSGGVVLGDWTDGRIWHYQPAGSSAEPPAGSPPKGPITELLYATPKGSESASPGVFDLIAETPTRLALNGHHGILEIDGDSSRVLKEFVPLPQMTAPVAKTTSGALWARSGMEWLEFQDGAPTGRSLDLRVPFVTQMQAVGETLYIVQSGSVEAIDTTDLSRRTVLALPPNAYGDLHIEDSGDIWVGTDGFGLYRRRATGEIDHWTVEDGLPTAFMGWIGQVPGPTENTHLWINSNAGVLAVTRESLEATAAKALDKLEFSTLMTGECLGPDGVALESGLLVLPTMSGPVAVDTTAPLIAPTAPALSISAVRSRGELVRKGTKLLGDTDLEFEYGAAEFPNRLTSRVEYRLEGHDEDWQLGGPDRRARYTSLGPGRYQLQLRSRAAGTAYSPTLTGDWLEILPRWHQRGGVRLAIAAALIALACGAVRLRTVKLVQHGEKLEAEIGRREIAESELRSSRERYRRLFRTTPTALTVWGREGNLLDYNEAAAKLFGPSTLERTALPDLIVDKEARDRFQDDFDLIKKGQFVAPFDADTYVQGKEVRPCSWHLACLGPVDQPEGRLVAVILDKSPQVRAANDLRELRQKLSRAEEKERSRMARELHDDYSQRLAAVSLNIRMTADSAKDTMDPKDSQRLQESQAGIDALAMDLHTLSRQLHPAVLDDLGLSAALRSECTRRASLAGLTIRFEVQGEGADPAHEVGLALFRVAQEALLNAAKHAEAQQVSVLLKRSASRAQLVVSDDGAGFDESSTPGPGLGLSSMRERMGLIGGSLTIASKPGRGTQLIATVELDSASNEKSPAPHSVERRAHQAPISESHSSEPPS